MQEAGHKGRAAIQKYFNHPWPRRIVYIVNWPTFVKEVSPFSGVVINVLAHLDST